MKIGELAHRTGVSVRSLRYYEQQGLLHATRTPGGHRDYPDSAVDRVIRIQQMFAAGLHSATMAELLPCTHDRDGTPNAHTTPFLLAELSRQRAHLDACITDLHRAREVLDEVIAAAADAHSPDPRT
ncbi:MerR family transcriptional regulator [Nocardia huaxiensis]|uniref:MerR family transcriptional regulator n=1 Tax=Nocardia huaxiensis TaxID=2755382 RepID=UPI001E4B2B63|nr:MerR family transcriptional regulator [Nocardia huaxiensis]UFS98148.1 MerR family transcriptional regulator [Nocardia huaxiensis]